MSYEYIQLLFKYINELILMFIIETRFLVRRFYEMSIKVVVFSCPKYVKIYAVLE
jgi:hypothetical protein